MYSLLTVSITHAQTGIKTETPQRTLHVNGSLQVTKEVNVGGNANTAGSAGTSGQVLTSNGTGVAPSWTNPSEISSGIYMEDGTLKGNRTVAQGDKTMSFTGTAVNAFSVDGPTFSVDVADNRVGIGTSTPQKQIHVNGDLQLTNELNVGGNATTAGSAGTAGQVLTSKGAGFAPEWQAVDALKGAIANSIYIQGTTTLTVNQGNTSDVPGVSTTITVPAGKTQTVLFMILGYAIRQFNANGASSQGVFSLLQDNVKISSGFASSNSSTSSYVGALLNLPAPVNFFKAIQLSEGTYTFKVQYSAWASSQVVNYNPTNYAGYNGDNEAMLTKMQVFVFNN